MVDVIKIDEREDEMMIPITLLITELSLSTINTRLLPVSEIIRSPVFLSTIKRLGLLRFPARMAPLVPPIVDSIGFDEYAEIKLFLLASLLVAKAVATAALPARSHSSSQRIVTHISSTPCPLPPRLLLVIGDADVSVVRERE